MSKMSREKVRARTNDEIKITHADEEEIKKKLKSEIRALRQYISQPVCSYNIRFKDLRASQNDNVAGTFKKSSSEPVDVEARIANELYIFAGFCCKKLGDRFIFAFQSFDNSLYSDKNWIELLKIEERWQLGKWVMPLTVDVKAIFVKYTIDSAGSMKLFLRECKHLLDCFHRRQYEYTKLQDFLLELGRNRVSVQTNYAYTRIAIKLVKAICQSSEETRYIILLLGYKNEEARPCRVTIDCEGENPLSDLETKDFKGLFKRVKEQELKEAVENALNSEGNPFIWKEPSEDRNSIIDQTVEEHSDEEMSFLKILKKKANAKKKQVKVSSGKEKSVNDISEDDDRCENDLSIDAADEEDASEVDIPKTVKTGRRIANKRSRGKRSLYESKANGEAEKKTAKSRTQALGRRNSLGLNNRNENACDTRESDVDGRKCIVAEMFKPNVRERKGFSKAINGVEINTGSRQPGKNSPLTSVSRSHGQLKCSTPIVERTGGADLSTVPEENISAIAKENTSMTATEITEIKKKIQDASGAPSDFDKSNLDESGGKDITKMEMDGQRELLKDLQAVKESATVTRKAVKRKAKSLAGGKKKVPRK